MRSKGNQVLLQLAPIGYFWLAGSHRPLVLISSTNWLGGLPAENLQIVFVSLGDRPKILMNRGGVPPMIVMPPESK